jgi:hypothetical protein
MHHCVKMHTVFYWLDGHDDTVYCMMSGVKSLVCLLRCCIASDAQLYLYVCRALPYIEKHLPHHFMFKILIKFFP